MAKNRQTIRSELRNDLRIDPNSKVWSDNILNQLIHEGEIEVSRRNLTITELETETTFNAVIGQRAYDLPTDLCRVVRVVYDEEQIASIVGTGIAFVDSNPDTITDTGNGFVTAGFQAGMKLQILNSTSNDGVDVYTIANVAAGTLTLATSDSVTAEVAGNTISIIGRSDPDHQQVMRRVEDIRALEGAGFNNIAGYPFNYAVYQNDLQFDILPKETDVVKVEYIKLPAEMATDATNSDIPDELIPLVRLWAQYLAWNQLPGEQANAVSAFGRFERELRRKITMRSFNDYALRQYKTANWRSSKGLADFINYG